MGARQPVEAPCARLPQPPRRRTDCRPEQRDADDAVVSCAHPALRQRPCLATSIPGPPLLAAAWGQQRGSKDLTSCQTVSVSTTSFSRSPRGSPPQCRGASSSGTTIPLSRKLAARDAVLAFGDSFLSSSCPTKPARNCGCPTAAARRGRAALGAAAAGRRRQESSQRPELILNRLTRAMTARGLVGDQKQARFSRPAHARYDGPRACWRPETSQGF
jgi:hypothetical protein